MLKIRSAWVFVGAFLFSLSLAVASNDGEKTKKVSAKKEVKSCCSSEQKAAKGCADMEMKDCEPKKADGAKQSDESKVEKKSEVASPEKK